VVAAADHILDIHSDQPGREPFWVYPAFARNAAAALAIGRPAVHLVMPQGLGSGTPVIQHGRARQASADFAGVGLVAECGQHFQQASADLAIDVARTVPGPLRPDRAGTVRRRRRPPQRFQLLQTVVIQTPEFRFVRPLIGFETFAQGELIATDGPTRSARPATTAPC
jgi:hypothetical protein